MRVPHVPVVSMRMTVTDAQVHVKDARASVLI